METSSYSTMTVAELKKLLTERNIKGRSHITKKSDMIDTLIKFDLVGEEENEDEDEDYIFEEHIDLEEYNEGQDEENGGQDWEISKEEYELLMEESELSLDDVMEKYK